MKKLMMTVFAGAIVLATVGYSAEYSVTSLDDIATAATALQVRPGDTVTLPAAGSGQYYQSLNVLFSSYAMEKHLEREEIREALAAGYGESARYRDIRAADLVCGS